MTENKKVSVTKILADCQQKLKKKAEATECENIRVAAICIQQAIDLIEKQRKLDDQIAKAAKKRAKEI
jgi:pyruvate/oxaloacetate carboxyltransferase